MMFTWLLVLVSAFTGHPMDLVFSSPLELVAIAAVVFAVNAVTHDGETTWFEGVAYAIGISLSGYRSDPSPMMGVPDPPVMNGSIRCKSA